MTSISSVHFINLYFSQHNYVLKAWVKATCFDLKSHRQARFKNREVLYNVAVRIWDPRWLTMCCDSYRVYNVTYIYYTIVIILKTKLRGLSPHANYTDRAAAAGRRS